ncbi:uncharacterized protein LOC119729390 [Patiria miniata]|uniref:MAM domain-containing protein n=1 Tax=Patiria miniata TaxID=46514 RepID=A0A914A3I9_PATMI|nr:uncharacterized protein LOC119729390 [Patiria miniata]
MFQFCAYLVFLSLLIWKTSADYRSLISCSFESACVLRQDREDDFDWAEGRGRIQGQGMFAPSADHTYGDSFGVYLYTPSDATREGQSAKLVSDELAVTTNTTVLIDFVYHMYDEQGQDRLGSLMVYINDDLVWSRAGNQGSTWMRALVNATCNSRSLQVTFEGILGGMHSDIGLDDISIGIYETTLPDPTVEVTPDVTPRLRPADTWRTIACVSLALVGLMAICVAVAVVYIFKLRKRLGDAQFKGGSGRAPSSPQCNVDLEPSGYLPLNATIDKTADKAIGSNAQQDRYGDLYLQPTVSQQPGRHTVHTERPEHIFLRSRKLSWNNEDKEGMGDCDYEYMCTD